MNEAHVEIFRPNAAYIDDRPPTVVTYNSAYATARFKEGKTITGAVYSHNGQLVSRSLRKCGPGDHIVTLDPPRAEVQPELRFEGRSCYIGHCFGHHYGHFITEGLPSYWLPGRETFDHIVAHPFIFGRRPKQFEEDFRSLLKIDKPVTIISRPAWFESLVIPQRIWTPNSGAFSVVREVLAKLRTPKSKQLRLYLSRRGLAKRAVPNEDEVESVLKGFGFDIVQPQDLTVEDQVRLYSNADVIAGFAGSALHNSLLAPEGTKIISLKDYRRSVISNQFICGAVTNSTVYGVSAMRDGRVDLRLLHRGIEAALSDEHQQ